MKLSCQDINYVDAKAMAMEVLYKIASIRVAGSEVLYVKLANCDMSQRFLSAGNKLFKKLKKNGTIQLYINAEELTSQEKTESIYLLNKYPELESEIDTSATAFLMKI